MAEREAGSSAGRQRSLPVRRVPFVAAFVIGAVIAAAWPVASNTIRDALRCRSSTTIRSSDNDDLIRLGATTSVSGAEIAMPVVTASPMMDCTYSFAIANLGSRRVRINTLTFEVLGRGPRGGAQVTEIAGSPMEPRQRGSDAEFDIGQSLEGGAVRTVEVRVRQNPAGCMSPGSLIYYVRAPEVSVSALGLKGAVTPLGATFGVEADPSLDCQ